MENEEEKRILRQNNLNTNTLKSDGFKHSESLSSISKSDKKENIEMYETLATPDTESNFYFILAESNERVKSLSLSKQGSLSSTTSQKTKRPPPPPPPLRQIGASIPSTVNNKQNLIDLASTGVGVSQFKSVPPPLPTQPPPPIPIKRQRAPPPPPSSSLIKNYQQENDLEKRFRFLPFPNILSLPNSFTPPLNRQYPSARYNESKV